MKIKNHRSTRSLRKNNKSRRQKRGGAPRHHEDENLRKAYRNIYDFNGDKDGPPTSYWLAEYLKDGDKDSDDYKKVEKINDMLLTGYKMMMKGYDEFEKLMEEDD